MPDNRIMKYQKFDELLKKELTRKQFIQVMVLGVISLLGFHNFIALFQKYGSANKSSPSQMNDAKHGFGSSKFGI